MDCQRQVPSSGSSGWLASPTLLIYLLSLLMAWSVGCYWVLQAVLGGSGSLFLYGWLIAALAGWAHAAHTIYRLITGQTVRTRGGRDL